MDIPCRNWFDVVQHSCLRINLAFDCRTLLPYISFIDSKLSELCLGYESLNLYVASVWQ